jgi:ABC-type transport system involved in multi-copper enzyme maturation permease subunit
VSRLDRVFVVVDRELRTLVRNRLLLAVGVVFFTVVVGLGWLSRDAAGGYVSLTYDLLLVVEVLVPVIGFAFVYRSIRGDDERGELDVIRTYPIDRVEYVLGVFIGRVLALVVLVLATLGVAGALASSGAGEPQTFLATHDAGDTVVVYLRFVLFVACYTVVVTALALAVSAATRTTRGALAAAVGGIVVLAVGLDLALLTLVSGDLLGGNAIALFEGASPASAFRGLVAERALGPALADDPGVATASPIVCWLSLLGWTALGLGMATVATWPDTS